MRRSQTFLIGMCLWHIGHQTYRQDGHGPKLMASTASRTKLLTSRRTVSRKGCQRAQATEPYLDHPPLVIRVGERARAVD